MSENEKKDPRLTRRLLVARVAGGVGLVVAAAVAPETAEAQSGRSDNDPRDSAGYGRSGRTDNDPNDGAGRGRSGGYRRGTGITDNDPSDGPGNGRGGSRGRSVSDNDPSDAPGRGRGWR